MKRQIISWGMMLAAAFTLTNCAKEIDNPNEKPETNGYPFEIVANTVDTKTVNDGMATKWDADDQINLFHAVGTTTDYKDNGAFTVSDVEAGRFTGELCEELDPEEEYDWYAIYPYSDKIATPGKRTTGFIYIGYSSGLNQSGYSNMSSLKGSVCPLYGVAEAWPAGTTPSLEMNHLSSVVAIKVTNENEEPLTITTASFTATEDIVGSYFIDITGESVVYAPSSTNYVKNTAVVNVTSGATALAQGESAILYAAIKPFTATAGQKLTLSVEGYSKEITLTNDVTFHAGKIKTLNFAYDKVEEPAPEGTNEVKIDLTAQGYTDAEVVTEVTSTPIKVSFNKGSASNAPAYYDSGTSVRVYAKASFTVESALGNITSIELTFGSSDKTNEITTNVGTFSTNTWTGSSKSVTFTIGGTKDHRRIKTINVTYVGDGGVIETQQLAAPVVTCTDIKSNSLTFEWAPVANATKYAVIFNGGEEEFVENTSYTKSGLSSETEYSISVKAIGDGIYYMDSESVDCLATTSTADQPEGDNTNPVKIDITFSEYTAGIQYAQNEEHKINDALTLYTTECHFTTQLRIYSSSTHNGFVVSNKLPGRITDMTFNAGNKVDDLDIYGSNDGSTWTKVGSVSVTSTSYNDYSFSFGNNEYTYFKLDVAGSNQIRIASMSVTYQPGN